MDVAVDDVMTMRNSAVATAVFVRLTEVTHRTFVLPLLIFSPTSRCNSRCISCDWWKHDGCDDLTRAEIDDVASALPALGTRVVAFSGGEPLLRPDVFDIAAQFRSRGLSLQLLTSGVLLEHFADRVGEHFSRVYISLDAATEGLYQAIRGINALGAVGRGVARLGRVAPLVPVMARATLHRANFRELPQLVEHAKAIGVRGISFLPADVSPRAFGREQAPDAAALALTRDDVGDFRAVVERTIARHGADFESGFIAESPDKLRRLPQYYAALAGDGSFPRVQCNAPWVSVVLEANGWVRPCFFHPAVGSVRREPLATILRTSLPTFRRALDVQTSDVCTRCVCSMNATWRTGPWH